MLLLLFILATSIILIPLGLSIFLPELPDAVYECKKEAFLLKDVPN